MVIPNFEFDNEVDRREREVAMHHDVVVDHVEHNGFDDDDLNDLLALSLPHSNLGFNNSHGKFTKISNAYMLVYIPESDKENIICIVDEEDIAEHIRIRLHK
ncbi:hypothetical protein K1719_026549 [Acacia pycnantha]|nr:hypothetical protein K1719_026549 [Acacia pycnantha]